MIDAPSAPVPAGAPLAAPVAERQRLLAIDATRGLALLGILLVNIQSFAAPFGQFITHRPESTELPTQVGYYFVKILCEGKFYPLFSLLFGMGLVLQMQSVTQRIGSRGFRWLYARRLLVLLAFGLIHALLFWYGDILFMYALCGFFLLLGSRLSARTMLIIGVVIIALATLIGAPVTAFMASATPPPGPTTPSAAASTATDSPTTPTAPTTSAEDTSATSKPAPKAPDELDELAKDSSFFRLMQAYANQEIQGGPELPLYQELEQRAYHDGPWLDLFLFRAFNWAMFLVFSILGFGWHILAMFYIGAGLLKSGFLDPARRPLRRKLLFTGAFIALPLLALSTLYVGQLAKPTFLPALIAGVTLMLGGPLLSLAYLSGISLAIESGLFRRVTTTLAAVGRMALTNYLSHTLICTTIFYFYGFAQFGEWTRPQRLALVIAIFAAQCIISPLWLSRFRFGPMEWLWRSLTYLRPQPMLRNSTAEHESA